MVPTCPLCDNSQCTVIYKNLPDYKDAIIVKCSHCFHVYTHINHEVETNNLYADHVYKVVDNRHGIFDKILSLEYGKVLKKINSLRPAKGSLLDFGAGKGKFGSLTKRKGWNVKCAETAIERAEYAKKVYSLEVYTKPYLTGRIFDEDFDVLTMFHVLEHLPNPESLMNNLIEHNLKKDSLVVIEVPNINSLQSKIAGRFWMHLDVPRHINHFSSARLEQLTNKLDIETIHTSNFSFHLGVLGMTDSILKKMGYKRNIIYELKVGRNKILIIVVFVILPFSFLAETIAAMLGRGGIVRKYFIRRN